MDVAALEAHFSKPFSDLRILGLQADEAACGHYRMTYPLEYLKRGGAQVQVVNRFTTQDLGSFDVILAQRQYGEGILERLLEARERGKTVLYEVDDNLHQVHPNSVAYNVYKPGSQTLKMVEHFLRGVDGLFVTTPELASAYRGLAKRTWVLPNQLDLDLRAGWKDPGPRDPRLAGKLVIGWTGSITHQNDIIIGDVLRRVLLKYPQTVFAVCSAHRIMSSFVKAIGLPERIVKIDPVDFEEYPRIPANFDIGVIPVEQSEFNFSKSDLKILEYGAHGVPYVASRIAPYARFQLETGGRGGYLAQSTHEWETALCRLIEDETERNTKSEFLRGYVSEQRNYASKAHLWAEAIREAQSAAQYDPSLKRQYVLTKPGRNDPCPCQCGKKYKQHREVYGAWG